MQNRQPGVATGDRLRGRDATAVLAAGVAATLGGAVSLAGWALDLPRLADWDGRGIAMQPNAAVAATCAGLALLLVASGRARARLALGVATGAIGAATLLQHATGLDLGIDAPLLFGRPWGRTATLAPGRMGIPASIAWTLVGAVLVLLPGGVRARRAAVVLALTVVAIGSLSVTGYVLGADVLYSLPRVTAIAFQTALILVAVGIGLTAAVPERQPTRGLLDPGAAGVLVRRTLPLVVGVPFAIGFVSARGEQAGLYDTAMGTSLVALANIACLCAVLWWAASAVRYHERALAEAAERSRAEMEELLAAAERARAEAEAANRSKDEFLALLSHELRAPLNAMLGWLRVLQHAGTDKELAQRAAETLERNVWAQAQVVDDLLDIHRIVSGKLSLERVPVELTAVVSDSVESLRPLAAEKGVALTLASAEGPFPLEGDPARLQQVVANVVGNAIKFTPRGGRVDVALERGDGRARVTVRDTGEGIPADVLPHVFDRFFQGGRGTTRRHAGLGLGLALVREVVALHGGEVRAESDGRPGQGATFTLSLPLTAPRALQDARAPAPAPGRAPGAVEPLELLVVDDDEDSRVALGLALERSGVRVRLAGSVREALAAWRAAPADVVVSDVAMPDEDGYALVRAIRAEPGAAARRAIAIAMTGLVARHDRDAALAAGFDDHIGKPVDVDRLLHRIRTLERRSSNAT